MFSRGGAIRVSTLFAMVSTFWFVVFGTGTAMAGGVMLYEFGTAEIGLASAGYGARAQDASTVFINPAGMTRLDGTQFLASGQILWSNTEFSSDSGTSPALGREDGGRAIGFDGWFPGGGGFLSYSLSPELKMGVALTGNFGTALEYDEDWVGRYYVKETALVGMSFLPSVAYKLTDKLSFGASLNVIYGIYNNEVGINNANPSFDDGELSMDDKELGWGVNLGLLYEIREKIRLGLVWNSQVDLDFEAEAEFSNLAPGLEALLNGRGLLDSTIKVGIKVPQQLMGSFFARVNDRWALLGSAGWQEWSKFGQVGIGIDDTSNPRSITTDLDFKDTWHVALGAQYRIDNPWTLNFGVAYDSEFQDDSDISLLLPVNSAWRFGLGAQRQTSENFFWGMAAEYIYGGDLDVDVQSNVPVATGGRGDVAGSYEDAATVVVGFYGSWRF